MGIIDTIFKKPTERESNDFSSPAFLFNVCLSGLGLFGFVGSTWRKRLLFVMMHWLRNKNHHPVSEQKKGRSLIS